MVMLHSLAALIVPALASPVTALEAFILFDERLGPMAIAGGVVAVAGVALVVTGGPRPVKT